MTDKIRIIKTDHGVFISIQDYCSYLHGKGVLTDHQRLGLRWKLMREKINRMHRALNSGSMVSSDFVLIFGVDDFFANWTYFIGYALEAMPKTRRNHKEVGKISRLIDSMWNDEKEFDEVFVNFTPVLSL